MINQEPRQINSPPLTTSPKKKVLVVDDDYQTVEQITSLLERFGYTYDYLLESGYLFDKLAAETPDIILLDVFMPDDDGLTLLKNLKHDFDFGNIPVIMITGEKEDDLIARCFELGAADFVPKPIQPFELKSRMEIAMASMEYINEIRHHRDELRRAKEFTDSILASMEDPLALVEAATLKLIKVNSAFSRFTQQTNENLQNAVCYTIFPQILQPCSGCEGFRRDCPVIDAVRSGQSNHLELDYTLLTGEKHYYHLTVTPIRDPISMTYSVLLVLRNITEIKKAQEHLKHLAFHDTLTGLPNRQLFFDRLEQAIAQAKRMNQKIAVMFFDLDHFKEINDEFGHGVGDKLLIEVAGRLQSVVRESDTVARLAGDEFTAILTNINQIDAVITIAHKIAQSLEKSYRLTKHSLHVTSSIGISIFPDDGDTIKTLLKNADKAVYRAKEHGRNNYQFYGKQYD